MRLVISWPLLPAAHSSGSYAVGDSAVPALDRSACSAFVVAPELLFSCRRALRSVYRRALAIELEHRGILVEQLTRYELFHRGCSTTSVHRGCGLGSCCILAHGRSSNALCRLLTPPESGQRPKSTPTMRELLFECLTAVADYGTANDKTATTQLQPRTLTTLIYRPL